jgi:hypothetical protein
MTRPSGHGSHGNAPAPGTWYGDPSHFRRPSRRDFLYVGMVGGLGLTLGDFLRSEAQAVEGLGPVSKEGKAKSVIQVFLPGGMAAQESWDPKLYSPIEYRGPLGNIETKIPGARIGELWKNTAQVLDKMTIVRSMTHGEAAHERGTHNMFTGYRPNPAIQFPSMGSIVSHEFGPRKNLPPYVCIPSVPNEFAGSGYLSSAYGAFSVGSDPGNKDFTVRDLSLPGGVDAPRFDRRKSMLATVDNHFKTIEKSDALDSMDTFYQRAYSMISSPEAREAFNLNAEPQPIRDEYGQNSAGQRLLLARRLVESGVRFVSTTFGGWDHHDNIKGAMEGNVPAIDQALASLIRDLDRRGLLDTTIVMVTSEFGRTPKINGTGGRDHYPKVFSIALAGGGIKRGLVYGKSDMTSTEPDENPLQVKDWATTMYSLLGIDGNRRLISPGNRPIDIVQGGEIVKDILA